MLTLFRVLVLLAFIFAIVASLSLMLNNEQVGAASLFAFFLFFGAASYIGYNKFDI